MAPGTDSSSHIQYQGVQAEETVVAKTLAELPSKQRQKITMELTRIHKMVSAMDKNQHKDVRDKA